MAVATTIHPPASCGSTIVKRPFACGIAALLGLVGAAPGASASGLAPHGPTSPAAPNCTLPLAGLQVERALADPGANRARRPGSKLGATVIANPSHPRIGDHGSLTSAPVSAFGFLSEPPAPRSQPVVAHRSDGTHEPSALARSLKPPPPPAPAANSVVLDSSLGQTRQPVVTTNTNGQNDYAIYGTMGQQVGGNLFFSFSAFNLAAQESATFSGPFTLSTPVQNILARVTGGVSSIDGLLSTSKIPGANFFLLNPAGVIFGPDAQLALGGSFIVSTADYIKLADGNTFNAAPGASDAALSSAAVAVFGFVSSSPASVQFNGSQLTAPAGAGLHVIAGAITLDSATLSAPSGVLTMFSASSAGHVPFSLASPGAGYGQASATAGGSISISNQSSIAIDGQGGGAVILYGGVVALNNSTISSNDLGSAPGGAITLSAASLSLTGGGTITSTASASTDGGAVTVTAGQLTISGGSPKGSAVSGILALSPSTGNGSSTAGSLAVNVHGLLTLSDGGEISASTLGLGNAGAISVTAGRLSITGDLSDNQASGIFAQSKSDGAGGAAGEIAINVPGAMIVSSGAVISSTTFGLGRGGSIHLSAGELTIAGGLPDSSSVTEIVTNSESSGAGGSAGNVVVNVRDNLTISGGAAISSSTLGGGNGGRVQITAGSLTIAGALPNAMSESGIFAQSASSGAGGAAGEITVNVPGALIISGGGLIDSSTAGLGRGGSVHITAGDLTVTGDLSDNYTSGIYATSSASGQGGAGGDIVINVPGVVTVSGGGVISAFTNGLGHGGSVQITAGQLTVTGGVPDGSFSSDIDAQSESSGAGGSAGNVTINVPGVVTISDGGEISSSTFGLGQGGSVQVTAAQLTIAGSWTDDNVSGVFADSNSNGPGGAAGDVMVNVPGALTISGGGAISSSTFGLGNGGSVHVAAGQLVISGALADRRATSGIFAESGSTGAGGAAGDVTVNVSGALSISGGGEISSATNDLGAGGSVQVTASNLTIAGALTDASVSGIFAESHSNGAGGPAGYVTVDVPGQLTLSGGGEISSATAGLGNGGSVQVTAGEISISGATPDHRAVSEIVATSTSTGQGGIAGDVHIGAETLLLADGAIIASSSTSSGNAGSVVIAAGEITLSGASTISTSASKSDAGSISIHAESNLLLSADSSLAASAGDNGGNITIACGDLVYLLDSSITATAGTLKGATAAGGAGGNITIDPTFIILDHSLISANAAVGRGGNILLETDNFLSSESLVTATGSTAGTVTIAAPELDLTNGLVGLSSALLDVSTQFREQCAQRLNQDFSSFLVVGQGGIDSAPDQAQASGSSEEPTRRKKAKEPAKKAGHSAANR